MNNIHVLDCTLRDGGYCNNWKFGFENSKKIMNGLIESNIDIIECGFITNKINYSSEYTKFNSLGEISCVIPKDRNNKIIVAMINYGEYDINELPKYDGTSIDGIRVAFHKKNRFEALRLCEKIKNKGYLVFVQPMVSLSYTDSEFLELIHLVNNIKPYAFYIVDSFGMMKSKDLSRLFFLVEHNLYSEIWIGFHSHNNMQLAFSNAQHLVNVKTNRNLIIDSSVYGMGRGAGNLNTEIFVDYLNENHGPKYLIKPLLCLIDDILNDFYQRNYWGYSLSNYISASHNAHPNYASYLEQKNTLTYEDMNNIFGLMDDEKKYSYDKSYIEELYINYMSSENVNENNIVELKEFLNGKSVLLIAPGKSSIEENSIIIEVANNDNVVVISINHKYSEFMPDFVFISNLRRFRELVDEDKKKCIVTSNILSDDSYIRTGYRDLMNKEEAVSDNAGLMAIKFLSQFNINHIYLAGFDGYSHDENENYGKSEMTIITKNTVLDAMNIGMSKVLNEYSSLVDISFITTPKYVKIGSMV